jgi:hypothetical protein
MTCTPEFKAALNAFVAAAQAKVDAGYRDCPVLNPRLSISMGRRYARIVRTEEGHNRSVYCFVDTKTGAILKAASWKAPAKGARGSIYAEDHGASAVTAYGAVYWG